MLVSEARRREDSCTNAAGGSIGPKDRVEPRDQVLHLAVGPLDELADVQNRSFVQSVLVWTPCSPVLAGADRAAG